MGFFGRLFGSAKTPIKHTITVENNPYKSRIKWPPNLSKISPAAQFRFEKKYRRRSKLKNMNPTWIKSVKIYQWTACSAVLIYSLLFYDWPIEDNYIGEPPFWTLRQFIFGEYAAIWTTAPEGWKPTPVYKAQIDRNSRESSTKANG